MVEELSFEYGTRGGMILQDLYAERKVGKFSEDGTLSFEILEELNPSAESDSVERVLENLVDEGKIKQISEAPEERYAITDKAFELITEDEYANDIEEDYRKLVLNYQ